jgi:hypothetical protein
MPWSPREIGCLRALAASALIALSGIAVDGKTAAAQKPAPKTDQKPDAAAQAQAAAQQQEVQTAVHLADAAMSGQSAPADIPIQLQSDFLRAQGTRVWVPLTMTLDPAKLSTSAVTLYLRVTPRGMTAPAAPTAPAPAPADKNAKDNKKDKKNETKPPAAAEPAAPNYPYEDVALLDLKPAAPGQPIRILRGIGVPSGSYDLYIVLHERGAAAGKSSVLKQPLDVPNYANGEFTTSSVILAERVDKLPTPIPPEQQSEHPYAFGSTEIVVSPEHKFKKSQELIVLLQIYNPMVSPEKKFSLEATYTFYRQDAGAEKRFNATEPQTFTSENVGASGFDPAGNAAIQAGQGIPLQSFPEGSYRLEIKVTDKLSSKAVTQNVNFTVTP